MTAYEIPLTPQAQTLAIALAGVTYNLTLQWRSVDALGGWVLDIADVNNNPLLLGMPLVTGTNLLAPFAYLGIAGALYVLTDGNALAVPTYANLGTLAHLYFYA
jgi:hypothetical protein